MKVSELIEYLKTQPQDLDVIYQCFSEQVMLDADEIEIIEACEPRPDGWIQDKRDDMPTRKYLCFPGN
ncbi:MAG TPA: hypothetical protein DCE77_11475 [Methylophaga sp.]|jgi:hypothetical protein|uniref:hypothetical protein n=1 Tax=unclassified Methylophaga TaxID=2629249 RepID=UPI000C911FBA|nr:MULTISPECIES: hypothetical protein [unclassified Methylophaga]MAP27740.1 hypothetical protein [Methylophaga sp.]HAD32186.1 hypothetical protein [Methylophaga sp.]HBX59867.1 hypothetical protein [Methylophaga sp.]|tara:strand:+ start:5848 stop:6051 length:204 start_codon:yes stop_codon:yes gene_type:complete